MPTAGNVITDTPLTGDILGLTYNKVGRYSQLNKNTVASTLYKYNAMGERVIKLYEPQIIEALALTEAFPILAPIIEALPAELQETIMVEFGGGGEATSNYESMPIPAIAGMTHYHYDLDHNLIAESISSGKVQKEYIYLPANLAVIADNIDLPSEALAKGGMSAASALPVAHLNNTNNGSSTNETLYIINDHLRTPAKLTTSAKAVVWDRFQTPFGENAALTGTKETNLRLPGQYFDFESNYHYNLMRDYDAKTGRYLQSDPIGLAGGLNRYGYVNGNPVNFVDPTGENPYLAAGLMGAALSAVLDASINNYYGNGNMCVDPMNVLAGGFISAIPGGALFKNLTRLMQLKGLQSASSAAQFAGRKGNEFRNLQSLRNSPSAINGRNYSGHALDQMQNRGFTPSVVENTLRNGVRFPGRTNGTTGFYDSVNNVRVIINSENGTVVTVIRGAP